MSGTQAALWGQEVELSLEISQTGREESEILRVCYSHPKPFLNLSMVFNAKEELSVLSRTGASFLVVHTVTLGPEWQNVCSAWLV